MHFLAPLYLLLCATGVSACDVALALTIDVSNSVDVAEYRLQTDGTVSALRDPDIVTAMVKGNAAIAVMQWSGADKQDLSVGWTQIHTAIDAERLALRVQQMERAFVLSDTAPAEAIYYALDILRAAPACDRRVIDISGDGTPNGGSDVSRARAAAQRAGVTINAIAIESMGMAITNFYADSVITRDGFVVTARTHRNYPEAIRAKILRELTKVMG